MCIELLSDILIGLFILISMYFADYLISFGGNGLNVMPCPNDSGCSGWKDPVGKTGTLHKKETPQLPNEWEVV